jgi:tRNA dimethylallyltransferase
VGPTATGKTDIAIAVAQELDGEVISLDSRQAYRGFEIGTAAPTADELRAVPHHGVGFLDPMEPYGAGTFTRYAHEWMGEIHSRGHIPILAGGTGFFLSALLDPIFREPPLDPKRRGDLRDWLDKRSVDELRVWVGRLDPGLGDRLERVDRQRASRALELALLTGRSLSDWIATGEPEHEPLRACCFALVMPAEPHRGRIESRARSLLQSGWVEEVLRLREAGLDQSPAFNAVGYRDVLSLADNEVSERDALERIVRATWAYARRQRTWFRHQLPSDAITLDALRPTGQLAEQIAQDWRASAGVEAGAQVSRRSRQERSINRTGVDTG